MFRVLGQTLALVFLAAAAAWATYTWHPRAPALYLVEEPLKNNEVSMPAIQERWKGDVIWIDARPEEQFMAEHVPGALLLNEQGFDQQLFQYLDLLQTNQKPIVVYCSGAKCEASRHVLERLKQTLPIENAFVLKGGWKSWKDATPH